MAKVIYKGIEIYSGPPNVPLLRKNNNEYAIGDVALEDTLPSNLALECIAPGTSASTAPSFSSATENAVIEDGSVSWICRSLLSKSSSTGTHVDIPTVTNTSFSYDGTSHSPTVSYDNTKVIMKGTSESSDVGDYTISFYLKDPRDGWTDGTSYPKSFNWSVSRGLISNVPSQSGILTYDGTSQSPSWSNYDSDKVTLSGTTTGVTAGNYTAVFTPKSNYQWNDADGVNAKNITWSIGKASGSMSLSKNSVSLNTSTMSDTVTVTREGDGEVSAVSSDTTVATVSVSGTTVTITAVANGSTTVTLTVSEGTNHTQPQSQSVSVSCSLVSNVLNDNDWATISAIAQAGTGDTYWDVGDVKMIELNGKIGNYLTLSNELLGVFILGFNHKDNNVSDNNIIFGGFKSALTSGKDVALCDNKYSANGISGTMAFCMNHWHDTSTYGSNYGGWKGSDLRYDILGATSTAPSQYSHIKSSSNVGYDATTSTLTSPKANTFLAALPSDLLAVLRLRTHYVDNKGNKSNVDANVTAVVDAVSLLAEYEIFGSTVYANYYERNHQMRMAYYANGNAKTKYKHSSNYGVASWWECSPRSNDATAFCYVDGSGSTSYTDAFITYALAPAFKV